jgi:AraC-like DNA-binding protein
MNAFASLLCVAALLAGVSALWTLYRARRDALDWIWLAFCLSMTCAMLNFAFGDKLGAYQYLLGIGATFTCNGFWLVTRALLRPHQAISKPVLAFALSISALLIGQQLLMFFGVSKSASSLQGLRALLDLLGSGVLVLSAYEMLIGYPQLSEVEKKVRQSLLSVYASCLLMVTIAPSLWTAEQSFAARQLSAALSACAILILGNLLVEWRRRHPLLGAPAIVSNPIKTTRDSEPVSEDVLALVPRIEHAMQHSKLYLDPTLKVADLADALGALEYKITQALSTGLAQKNFNQYVNRYRVDHAQTLLRDTRHKQQILQIALESGFASLGPFNRAFKTQTGMTPSDYRQRAADGLTTEALC